ncbi:MAG: 2OG-Fe(II) oxygenase [Deltaproteobacteria bacterium]|jgi:hypothetical protein
MSTLIKPLDVDRLTQEFRSAEPFPWIHIHPFLEEDFAREVAAAMPSFEWSKNQGGRAFTAVNEMGKVQLCESDRFPEAVKKLSDAISGPEFLGKLERITGIDNLLADDALRGGGIHVTGPRGRLDVHVDFNYIEEDELHRRLNILIYLNPEWDDAWGGAVELWDKEVQNRHAAIPPKLNHCLIFETSEISFHGVQPVTTPPGVERKSFAAYYYTKEAPASWTGEAHTTVFKARPEEKFRGNVLMPIEKTQRELRKAYHGAKKGLKRLLTDR